MANYIDPVDQSTYSFEEDIWQSNNHRPLMVTPLPGITREDIIEDERSIWRYQKALPFETDSPVSLGEGCTPLVTNQYAGISCQFKLEWFSPTGSFKDRGASVLLSFLRQKGISVVIEDSSGNGGAAIAAYAAAAGISAKILAPESTQPAKIAQIRAYGAEVILIPASREAAETAAIEMSSKHFYASHNWHPMFLQGTKMLGYELWEDLGYKAPDNIIIPAGAGSNILGCYIAFKELVNSGEIDNMPKIFASQPANCSPIHDSFQKGIDDYIDADFLPTVAEGTAIKRPVRLREILIAIRETNGATVVSEEGEIIEAGLKLAKSGLYAEPTSAHAASAFSKLIKNGSIKEDEQTVMVLTGTGLKATAFYRQQLESNN